MRMKLKNFYKPTPVRLRKLGDAILATSTFITGGGMLAFDQIKDVFGEQNLKIVLGTSFILGVVSKFITNLFSEEKNEAKESV